MNLEEITPLILTYDEAPNIERTLAGLTWARQILVVDSGSTDGTAEILAQYPTVRVTHRSFDNFAAQCNFGLDQIKTPWVLSIDADYVCPIDLEGELRGLQSEAVGYVATFVYCVSGRPLRSCLYPPRIVLFRTSEGRYVPDGHAHKLQLNGGIDNIKTRLLHDDRKSLTRWLSAQNNYADLEVKKLLSTRSEELGWKDRLRKKYIFAPFLTLAYCLFGKRIALDGWAGIYYTGQRVYAELLLSIKLLDAKFGMEESLKKKSPRERSGSEQGS